VFSVKFVSGHVHSLFFLLLLFLLFLLSVFLRFFCALNGEIGTWIGTHFPEEPQFFSKSGFAIDAHTAFR